MYMLIFLLYLVVVQVGFCVCDGMVGRVELRVEEYTVETLVLEMQSL